MEDLFDIPADLDTPVSAYLKLAPFRPRFLLESADGGNFGRHSFIGFGDGVEARVTPDHIQVNGDSIPLDRRPETLLRALRQLLSRSPRPRPELPGFSGGLVGFAGFGLTHRLLGIRRTSSPAPVPEAAFVATPSLLVFDHQIRRAALLHDGPEAERRSLRSELMRALRGPLPVLREGRGHEEPRASLDRPEFLAGAEKALRHIAEGDVYQVVLSVRFSGECDVPPFQAYRSLRLLNPSPYLYFLDLGDLQVAGSSPEALARLEGDRARLRPIAGTRPRGSDPRRDRLLESELLEDAKEAAEHVMLVDLARNDLGRLALPGSIAVEPFRAVERYSHVMHLVSGVRGILPPGRDAFDLFAAVFPAGTVAGAPKVRAVEVIQELEPVARGVYAGTVGYFGHRGAMDQAIAIRTLVFRDGTYAYQAGAGIVAESRPEREHDEVMSKASVLREALSLAGEAL